MNIDRIAARCAEFGLGPEEIVECATCGRLTWLRDTYSPGDEAICTGCNHQVTGRPIGRIIDPMSEPPPKDQYGN